MSAGDIYVKDPAGYNTLPVVTWNTLANTTVINPGEPVKVAAAGCKYAIVLADGDGVIGTTVACIGLATKISNQTTTVNGTVDVQLFMPGVIYAGKAKSSTAATTVQKIQDLMGKRVPWDLTSSVFTVDTAAADNANNALLIVGGNYLSNEVYFMVRPGTTLIGNLL